MIDADAELEILEQEFPESSRAWATDTDAALDRRILYIADAAARHLAQRYREEQRDISSVWPGSSFPRPRPGDDATFGKAGRRERAMESPMPYDMLKADRLLTRSPQRENTPADAEEWLAFLQEAEQHVWLDRIADIVIAGDVELAMYLLGQYRIKFVGE